MTHQVHNMTSQSHGINKKKPFWFHQSYDRQIDCHPKKLFAAHTFYWINYLSYWEKFRQSSTLLFPFRKLSVVYQSHKLNQTKNQVFNHERDI